jgi:translation initiation factor 2 subunit 2
LEKPILDKVGTKKIVWKNFETICKQMNRDPNHVYQYFLIELGTEGYAHYVILKIRSLSDEKFLIKGKYSNSNIESLIKKYLRTT